MHLPPLIQDLAVILGVAGLMSLIFQRIRQPVVLGYIIAGIIVGPYTPPFQFITDLQGVQTWAELGVIFLMFTLGLEFSFRKLARVGASAGITASTEVLFFLPVGYFVGKCFGWSDIDSIFLGAMLSISSTTIIIKAVDELKLKTYRFAELIFAALIVEDLIAILLLVGLTTIATSESVSGMALLSAAGKLILVVGGWFLVGYFVVPRFMQYVGRVGNNEMFTLVSLGLCLGLVVFATHFHYSTALGAFIMGSILAESSLLHTIEERMEPLRDLFGAIFFVSIGMLIDPRTLWEYKGTIAILCGVTIVGKILSTGFGALISGQTFRNSVRVGFGLAQIGEFSFIIAGLGMTLKVTSPFIYPIAVAVSLVTTFTTPYLIKMSGPLAERMEKALPTRIRDLLNRYALWSEERRTATQHQYGLSTLLARWLINGVTVSVVFVLGAQLLVPHLSSQQIGSENLVLALGWTAAVIFSAPFIWGMITAFKTYSPPGSDAATRRAPIFLFRLLSFIWIAGLSSQYFPGRYIALVLSVVLIVVLGVFYRRLESVYDWFEKHFLSTFEAEKSPSSDMPELAPWDAHLVRLQVHPNAPFSGKKLLECQLRNKHGINVVAIQRGIKAIVAPKPEEAIFPLDELLVLGTDENLQKVRPFLEGAALKPDESPEIQAYELKHIEVGPSLVNTTIRNSGIRERYESMVVGLERGQRRYMNPDSDMVLEAGDLLWVVGLPENLTPLQQEWKKQTK